jgi:hypothetical protein
MTRRHSTPWVAVGTELYYGPVAAGTRHQQMPSQADAEFIVRAVNSHDDLLTVCISALEVLGRQSQSYQEDAVLARLTLDIEAAVARAEGVKSSAESPAP